MTMVVEQYARTTEVVPSARYVEEFIAAQPETHGVYHGMQPEEDGVYISPAVILPAATEAHLPRFINAERLPGAELGAGDSQNGVVFFDLETVVDGVSQSSKVAVKPFAPTEDEPDKAQRALHEHDRLVEAASLGFDTFTPLALMKDGERVYLVTKFRPDIQTLDNADWTISPSDTERYEAEVLPNLHFIATHMGETHGRGLFNGDPQVKNFAKADTGQAVVMDLEYAMITTDPAEHSDWLSGGYDIRDSKAYQDVKQFWFALTRGMGTDNANMFLANEDYELCLREFEHNFLEPYIQSLQKYMPVEVSVQLDIDALRGGIYEHVARMP